MNNVSFFNILMYYKCNWNYHINYIIAKLNRSIAIINKIKNKLPLKIVYKYIIVFLKVI